ncbi:hypothetical protein LguiB_026502 [Lonicera macranthoides]
MDDIDDCQKPILEPYAKFSDEDYCQCRRALINFLLYGCFVQEHRLRYLDHYRLHDHLKTSLGQRWSPDVELYYREVLRSQSIPTNLKDFDITKYFNVFG